MVSSMKTTIDIPAPILAEAKRLASKRGLTLRDVAIDLFSRFIGEASKPKPKFKLRDTSVGDGGLTPEFKHADWATIRDVIYDRDSK